MAKIKLDVYLNGLEYDRRYDAVTQVLGQLNAIGLAHFTGAERCNFPYLMLPNTQICIGTIEADYEMIRALVPAVKRVAGEHAEYLYWQGNNRGLVRMDEANDTAANTLEGMFKIPDPNFSEAELRVLGMTFGNEELGILQNAFRRPVVTEGMVWEAYAKAMGVKQTKEAHIGTHPTHF